MGQYKTLDNKIFIPLTPPPKTDDELSNLGDYRKKKIVPTTN